MTNDDLKNIENATTILRDAFRCAGIECEAILLAKFSDGLALIDLLDPERQDAAIASMDMVHGALPRQVDVGGLALRWPAERVSWRPQ